MLNFIIGAIVVYFVGHCAVAALMAIGVSIEQRNLRKFAAEQEAKRAKVKQ